MSEAAAYDQRLTKPERLCSQKRIDLLFRGGESHALTAYPLRVVYALFDRDEDPATRPPADARAQMMVSVPKRWFKRAVDRNRVKRQVREGYRKNKGLILAPMQAKEAQTVAMAFLWMDKKLLPTADVEQRVATLLKRMGEKL